MYNKSAFFKALTTKINKLCKKLAPKESCHPNVPLFTRSVVNSWFLYFGFSQKCANSEAKAQLYAGIQVCQATRYATTTTTKTNTHTQFVNICVCSKQKPQHH